LVSAVPEFMVLVAEPGQARRQLRVHADTPYAVAAALGLPPVAILEVQAVAAAKPAGRGLDLRLFSQELALLLQSGIPVLEALDTLREKDAGAAGRPALDAVSAALREGQSISAALGRAPTAFDPLFVAVVAASERSGQMVRALQDHAAYLAWSQALRSKLVAASVYPLMLLGAGAAVVLFLLLYVLPRFASVFDALGDDVPDASLVLINFGVWAAAHPLLTGGVLLSLPLAVLLAWHSPPLRRVAAAWLWRAPVVGPRWRVVVLARLYRGLALLLGAGVPVPAALKLLHGAVALPLQPALVAATAAVASGQRLSVALQDHGLATPVAQRMVRVGEGSGELAVMLERAASFHDEEISRFSELMVRAVNPALMLVMGVVIGGIVVLMYLPIFSLMERVQ
jgi:general secretion pathway protein F